MIEITKMLTLSTAHLAQSTVNIFNDNAACESLFPDIIVYPKGDYGYFISILPEAIETAKKETDSVFYKIILMADSLGCQMICFDRDAEPLPWLETFDW